MKPGTDGHTHTLDASAATQLNFRFGKCTSLNTRMSVDIFFSLRSPSRTVPLLIFLSYFTLKP